MAPTTEIQAARAEAKSLGLSAAGGLKAIQERIAKAKADSKGKTPKTPSKTDADMTPDELAARKAKRSEAAKKAVATMRANGTLPPERVKEPVDPALSARAKKAWATRAANAAAKAAEAK